MQLYINKAVFRKIMDTIGKFPPERGGILGGFSKNEATEFLFDEYSIPHSDRYIPSTEQLNRIITEDWIPRELQLLGIIHSHDGSCPFPSCGDLTYGEKILRAQNCDCSMFLLILTHEPFRIINYHLSINNSVFTFKKAGLCIR